MITSRKRTFDKIKAASFTTYPEDLKEQEMALGLKTITMKLNVLQKKKDADGKTLPADALIVSKLTKQENPNSPIILDLSQNNIADEETIEHIEHFIQEHSVIELDLSCIDFSILQSGAHFFKTLATHPTLQKLTVNHSGFNIAQSEALLAHLKVNTTLLHLDLYKNDIIQAQRLEDLAIDDDNDIDDEKTQYVRLVSDLIANNKHLLTLDLSYLYLTPKHAILIANALKHNSKLEELYLGMNHIDNQGAIAIFNALQSNPSCQLKTLDLNANDNDLFGMGNEKKSDAAIAACAAFLAQNKTLTTLKLMQCPLNDNTNIANQHYPILTALETNTTLNSLNWNHSALPFIAKSLADKDAAALTSMLRVNKSLTELFLRGSDMDKISCEAFIAGLAENTSLRKVSFNGKHLTPELGLKLLNIVKTNHNYCEIDIDDNPLSENIREQIRGEVFKNQQLQQKRLAGWQMIAPIISFFRANPKHIFHGSVISVNKYLISPLLKEGGEEPKFKI